MSAGTFNQPQTGYQQQPGYGAQVAGKSGMAVASLVLGIVAMLTFWVWIGGLLFAPLAIVFGVLGRKETRGGPKSGEGLATAGLVLGILAVVLMVPWGIIVAMS
jgi:Domain of unknown function (DUF4190)